MNHGQIIRFLECELNLDEAELTHNGAKVTLEPQVFDLIRYFAENAGHLVTRDDIINGVWGGRIVSDAAISTRINAARKALGDDGKAQRIIKTIPRRGFRFLPETKVDTPIPSSRKSGSDQGVFREPLSIPEKPSIAVLPFKCLSDDAETRHLAQGLRIDIQNALVKVSGLFIIAIGSSNTVAELPFKKAADALGIRHFLQGYVRKAGDTVRFSVQLVDALDGRIIWSEQYDRRIEDTFKYIDEVTSDVLTSMNVKLVAGEAARVWHKTLADVISLEIFYRGISNFFKMNKDGLRLARHDFQRIAKHHPDVSLGPTWVSLTHWYDLQRGWAVSRKKSHELARHWAEKAVAMQDNDGQACTVLSHVYLLDRDFDAAMNAGAAAVRNRPNCTHANGFYANVLHYCGEQSDALKHIRLAIRHSPIHPPLFKLILANVLRANGDMITASSAATDAIQANADDIAAHVLLTALAVERDDMDGAIKHAKDIESIEPGFSVGTYLKRQPYRNQDISTGLGNRLLAAGLPK
ncbi:MAG: winged helix-turn-helix domain-containing protein [Paracoccaceae bacterium]